jgi:hypothetical protein
MIFYEVRIGFKGGLGVDGFGWDIDIACFCLSVNLLLSAVVKQFHSLSGLYSIFIFLKRVS